MSEFPVRALFTGMNSWYLNHTARGFHRYGALTGYWMGNKRPPGIPRELYRRVWPYHLVHKPFLHLPFLDLEERVRWRILCLYELWMRFQKIPEGTNVVQAPMGSCEVLFELVRRRKVLKVFDAPNSHPLTLKQIWQGECDIYAPGYKIPIPDSFFEKVEREIQEADLVLCPSRFVYESMIQHGVSGEKCFITHFGVDTSIFKPREKVPDDPIFICVGSICLRKGHHYLFRAWEKIKPRLSPNARLICIGGVRKEFQKEWSRWKGTFEHYPYLTHESLAQRLLQCTAFVFPSLEEGFARVLSEAMACGLPVIATHQSGATTVVQHQREGLIIPSRNVDAIVEAMLLLAKDKELNSQMGRAAYNSGAQKNSWQDYSLRLLREYSRRIQKHNEN